MIAQTINSSNSSAIGSNLSTHSILRFKNVYTMNPMCMRIANVVYAITKFRNLFAIVLVFSVGAKQSKTKAE